MPGSDGGGWYFVEITKLQKRIEKIEENFRAAYNEWIYGFKENRYTNEIFYTGTDDAVKSAFVLRDELKDELKV